MTPPRGALLLMRLLLPRHLQEAISGDLEEEWAQAPHPSRAAFWNQALRSIGACWIDRLSVRPARQHRPVGEPRLRGDNPVHALLQDIRYGARLMWRNPGFTVAAVLTLALGIGANSAIFSLVNVLSLKPLPYRDADRVTFVLGQDAQEGMRFNLTLADYVDLQQRVRSMEAAAAYTYLSANLTGGDIPERVQAYRVTANTFDVLGVRAALGRTFDARDAVEGRHRVVVLSHGLWQRRFGGDGSIVGRLVDINGTPHEIVGVMPARFEYPVFNFKGDLWMPWAIGQGERGQAGAASSATVVARLRPGVSYSQAQAELDTVMDTLAAAHPETNRGLGARLVQMGRLDEEYSGPAVSIVLATVALVLILACVNVANLLLARGVSRSRELAVRAALGASRARIARQLIVEGLLLALAGGAVGVLLALPALDALRAALPELIVSTQPNVNELGIDRTTLGYTLILSLATGGVFASVPAWRASRGRFQDGLKESAAAGGSRATRRLRAGLVAGEVALSMMLLVGAGLLVRSYVGLLRVDAGFVPSNVLTLAVTLPDYKYPNPVQRTQFYEQSLERIERLPGVTSAGYVNVLPFSTYDRGTRLLLEGVPLPEPGREPSVSYRVATPRYAQTLGVPIHEGRSFDRRDRAGSVPVALVNRTLAARFFGAASPLGRRVRTSRDSSTPWLTIVGVVGDVRHSQLTAAPDPEIYVPLAQAPAAMMMLAVRTDANAEQATHAVRAAIAAVDPSQPVYHVKTLDRLVADSLLPRSTAAALMTIFSALALVLAAVGIYGVVSYGVSQQTREFGVRMALGATRSDLLRLVLRSGLLMVGVGIGVGTIGALAASRLLSSALFAVTTRDPLTYAGVVAVLGLTGLTACMVPAWRASRVPPVAALRIE